MNAIQQWNVYPVLLVILVQVALMEQFFRMGAVFVRVASIKIITEIVRIKCMELRVLIVRRIRLIH